MVKKLKSQGRTHTDSITLEKLRDHFMCKFSSPEKNTEYLKSVEVKVKDHYERLCVPNDRSNPTIVSIQFIINYIKQLNTKCSPGIDGIYSEHLKYAVNSSIPLHISTLISLCVTYGHVPDSFLREF